MATPNPLYYAQFPLQEVIYDKTTGDPLAGGIVTYYSDPSFTVPLSVFEQSNAPDGSYVYTNIGNTLILSGLGSFVDSSGANFIPFLYPYNSEGVFTPYFIYVTDSSGAFQFSVTGWPPNEYSNASSVNGNFTTENQIQNPQFAETLFYPALTATITVSGSNTITPIAPGWFINTTGTGTVTLTQNNLTLDTDSNAPYSLTIATVGITGFFIYQRIFNSPRLFATDSVAGFFEASSKLSTSVLLTMTFAPSTGTTACVPTQICQGSTTSDGSYSPITGAAAISLPINLAPPSSGYVDIIITPDNPVFTISLTSIQIVPVASPSDTPIYNEVSVPIQKSLNSSYWVPKLAAKAIPSYLVGWDWGLNPFQAQGTSSFGPFSFGASTSYYIADQTILFQSVTSGFTSALSGNNLVVTCNADSSGAIIQYVSPLIVQELLSQRMSVQIQCSTTNAVTPTVPVTATISLWWTAGVIPTITPAGSYASLFTAISSAGVPTPTSGWTQVPNTYPTQSFAVPTASSPFYFSGFDATAVNTSSAVNFAIAITFSTMKATNTLNLNYCSLVGGDIPTRPAPQTPSAVLKDCQYYYQSSFAYGTKPAQAVAGGSPGIYGVIALGGTGAGQFGIFNTYAVPLRINGAVTLYSPVSANAFIYNYSTAATWTASDVAHGTTTGFAARGTGDAGGTAGQLIGVNFSVDSRLGVV